jgi:hypothetical protein
MGHLQRHHLKAWLGLLMVGAAPKTGPDGIGIDIDIDIDIDSTVVGRVGRRT